MLDFQKKGVMVFEYGNDIRARAQEAGVANAFDISSFMTCFIRPFFWKGRGPFRWIAVSGEPSDIATIDDLVCQTFPDDPYGPPWIEMAKRFVPVQGLPARICWLMHGQRSLLAVKVNELVRSGKLKGPVAFTRDNLDAASVAMPFRETENLPDGSDAIADWPLLNALLNVTCRADLVTIHSSAGGSTGLGMSCGTTIVADGSDSSEARLEKTLNAETGLGIMRYADAGYDEAVETIKKSDIRSIWFEDSLKS
jgi:urocanate hydratase